MTIVLQNQAIQIVHDYFLVKPINFRRKTRDDQNWLRFPWVGLYAHLWAFPESSSKSSDEYPLLEKKIKIDRLSYLSYKPRIKLKLQIKHIQIDVC